MKDFFKPDDFKTYYTMDKDSCELIAQMANDKLNALIESWTVVYSFKDAPFSSGWSTMDKFPNKNPTHQARLAFLEERPKEPCKHEPDLLKMFQEYGFQNSKCKHCGIELRATWSPK